MTEGDALGIVQQAIWLTIILAGPVIASAMIIGVGVAFFQALTQVQEMTLTFVPKVVVVFVVLLIFLPFMLHGLIDFTHRMMDQAIAGGG